MVNTNDDPWPLPGENEQLTEFMARARPWMETVYDAAWLLLKVDDLVEEVVEEVIMKAWLKRKELTEAEKMRRFLFTEGTEIAMTKFPAAVARRKE